MSRKNPTYKELAIKHKWLKKLLKKDKVNLESFEYNRKCKKCLKGIIDKAGLAHDGRPQYKCGYCNDIFTYGKKGYDWDR